MLLILGIYFTEPFLPDSVQQALYALSLTTQSAIMMVLPFIIFGLLYKTVVRLANQAAKTIFSIILLACTSSFVAILLAQCVGRAVYSLDIELLLPEDNQTLYPLWNWRFPKLIPTLYALISGIALGGLSVWIKADWAEKTAQLWEAIVSHILRVVTWILPPIYSRICS